MDIVSKMVEFGSNGGQMPGYLARPASRGPYPGVIVIQEWWGLVPHIKSVVDRFAQEGFVAMAPDLYHGKEAKEPDEARKLAMELDRERAVLEIEAAMSYLQEMDDVAPEKIGVVGFCMGGSLTIAVAARSQQIGAAVAFYGVPRDLNLARKVRAPLLGLYGELDHGIPVETVQAFEQELHQYGVPHEIHIYPGAAHAFFNDTRPQAYHPEAARDAWQRTITWLKDHLK